MRKPTLILIGLIILAALTCALCTYQIFFNQVDASLFRCSDDTNCFASGIDCSGSVTCTCTSLGTNYPAKCQFGHPAPIQ